MDARITHVDPFLRIAAIKGIRKATGLGLKDAKDVYDAVSEGRPQVVALNEEFDAAAKDVIDFEMLPETTDPLTIVETFVAALPADMTARQVWDVLSALRGASA